MSIQKYYSIILFFFVNCQLLVSQNLSYEEYTDKDGLPSMQTYDIIQDSLGILWIGSENGLVSFDGKDFVRYSHPDLIDNDIIKVIKNSNGRICFLNLSGQLGYIVDNNVLLINTSKFPKPITGLISKKEKDYIIVTDSRYPRVLEIKESPNRLYELIPTDIAFFNVDEEVVYSRINKNVFVSNYDSTRLKPHEKYSRRLNSLNKSYYFNDFDHLYEIYEVDQTLLKFFANSSYRRFTVHDGNFFIIKDNETIYYDSKSKSFIPFLSNIKVNTIFFDLENNAWCSTYNKGLLKVSNTLFKLKQKQVKLDKGITDICQDKNGNTYLGTSSSGIIINPLSNVQNIKVSTAQRPVKFYDNGDEILGFDDNSLFVIDCNSLNYFHETKYNIPQKAILVDERKIYLGAIDGMFTNIYDNNLEYDFNDTQKIFFKGLRISKIHKQKETDQIFVGTKNGLAFSLKDSFAFVENDKLKSASISSIIDGENKSIWIGTKADGIYKYRNDSILYHYNNTNGLISNNVNDLEIHESELMVSTASGLTIIDLSNNTSKVVNENNFLTSNKVNVCKVINGKYWIGTEDGLTILTKGEVRRSTTARPILSLKKFYINSVEKEYTANMELTHSSNNIQINLQNISFNSGTDKKIIYRIPLIDSIWIFTTDPNLRLPSLKPGKYHIEAIGLNSIGLESKPLNIYFNIDLPWWNKWWAKVIGLLILVGLVNFLLLLRSKRIRKEETVKHNYLKQINKIKDQALQLQMNPHFIFNSLNAIQGFIGTDEEEMAMNYLARFARLIRLIFEHSKGNTITLEEELEFIKLYLDLEKLRFKDKVNVQMSIDPELESIKDVLKVPPLLIQPIVENSFKHGLFHKKGKGNLKIDYTMQNEVLQVIIQDDGIGRVESNKITQRNNEKQTSSGIKTTIERIDLLNFGKDKKLNSAEIVDLYDDAGNAMGTKTILKLNFISK